MRSLQALDRSSTKLRVGKPETSSASSQSSSASAQEVKKRVPRINASQAKITSRNQTGLLSSRAIVAGGFRIHFLLPLRRRTLMTTIITTDPQTLPGLPVLGSLHMAGSLHLPDQTSRECHLPRTGMKTWMRLSAKSAVSSSLHHGTGHASVRVLGGSAA